jgi:hypothetical protein
VDDLRDAEAHFRLDPDPGTKQALVDAAVQLLAQGYDTPSLWILAGEDNADEREVESYLDRSLTELGLSQLSEERSVLAVANRDAKALLEGALPTNDAAERLWTLYARHVAGGDEGAYPSEFIDLAMDALMVTEELHHPALDPDLAAAASAYVAWHSTFAKPR